MTTLDRIRDMLACKLLGHAWTEALECARCQAKPKSYAELLSIKRALTSRREVEQDNGNCS